MSIISRRSLLLLHSLGDLQKPSRSSGKRGAGNVSWYHPLALAVSLVLLRLHTIVTSTFILQLSLLLPLLSPWSSNVFLVVFPADY